MSEKLSPWVSATASPSAFGDRFCVIDPRVAAALLTEHREFFEVVARDTALGPEEITRDLPSIAEEELETLDDDGFVRVGTEVRPGDLVIGKITPPGRLLQSPEEKLLNKLFGDNPDIRDTSLRVPPGVFGRVVEAGRQAPSERGEIARGRVTITCTRPLEVGDILVDRGGNRSVVAAIRPMEGAGLAWGTGGAVEVAKVGMARDTVHARSIGPYSLITQQPLGGRASFGGQALSAAQFAALAAEAPWATWELLTVKSDSVGGRTRAYEDLVRGIHPGPDEPALPEGVQVAERELAALGLEVLMDKPPLKARWLTSAEIRERSHGEVKKPETINYRTFAPEVDGLFCGRIFGPVRDYECVCGKYKRIQYRGMVCEECGVEVIPCRVRRERSGHVELAVPLPHPWRLHEVAEHLGLSEGEVRRLIDGDQDLRPDGTLTDPADAWDTAAALSDALAGTDLVLDAAGVLPPDLRPLVPLDGGRFATSDLNDLYRRLVNRNNRLRRLVELNAPGVILRNEYKQLFGALESLFDNAHAATTFKGPDKRPLKSLADMVAFHAETLLQKRSDYSAVAHLTVDPDLERGVCRVPLEVAAELFKPWAYGLLEAWGRVSTIKAAKALVEGRDPVAMAAIRGAAERWPVLLATEDALTGCRVVIGDGSAIAVCPRLGEELQSEVVRLFVPLGAEACAEVRALQGRVLEAGETQVEVSGWFSALVDGAPVKKALFDGIHRGDPLHDAAIRVALGWWPGAAPDRVEWMPDVLAAIPRPGSTVELARWETAPLSDLALDDDVVRTLGDAGLRTVGELLAYSEVQLAKARIGRRALKQLKHTLEVHGLTLRAP